MTPDLAAPFLGALSTFLQLAVAAGIVAVSAAIVLGTWELIHTAGGRH